MTLRSGALRKRMFLSDTSAVSPSNPLPENNCGYSKESRIKESRIKENCTEEGRIEEKNGINEESINKESV